MSAFADTKKSLRSFDENWRNTGHICIPDGQNPPLLGFLRLIKKLETQKPRFLHVKKIYGVGKNKQSLV